MRNGVDLTSIRYNAEEAHAGSGHRSIADAEGGPIVARGLWLVLIAALLSLAVACDRPTPAPERDRISILTGRRLRVFYPFGQALARIYSAGIPGVAASAHPSAGSAYNVRALEQGDAELALTQSDVAYFAYRRGTLGDPRPYHRLRAIAVLYVSPVHIIVPRESAIRRFADLRGRRVAVGVPTGGAAAAAQVILDVQGLSGHVLKEPLSIEDEVARLQSGELEAGFIVAPDPIPALVQLNAELPLRLIAIDSALAERTRSRYPFFRPTQIPSGVYEGHTQAVNTLGVDNLLVCRADLPDELVYQLTRTFIESLSVLAHVHPALMSIDPDQASATPIPLHPGAALYYRERELFK